MVQVGTAATTPEAASGVTITPGMVAAGLPLDQVTSGHGVADSEAGASAVVVAAVEVVIPAVVNKSIKFFSICA